jgi:hypothetical protein
MKASVTIEIGKKDPSSKTSFCRYRGSRFIVDFALFESTDTADTSTLKIPVEKKTVKMSKSISTVYKNLKVKSVKPVQLSLFE